MWDTHWDGVALAGRQLGDLDYKRQRYSKTAGDYAAESEREELQQVSALLDWTPGVNVVKAGFQMSLGFDLVTGEEVNRGWNAAMMGLSLVPAAGLTASAERSVLVAESALPQRVKSPR
jgi:hypothetical protein